MGILPLPSFSAWKKQGETIKTLASQHLEGRSCPGDKGI